ncbi:hypothetical protein [Thauera sp.]|uniref:hypothetical protein n=1 Tax=Thauera sp. TaxID=1905334 RepID=UPI0039E3AE79
MPYVIKMENQYARPGEDGDIAWTPHISKAETFESEDEAHDTATSQGYEIGEYTVIRLPERA